MQMKPILLALSLPMVLLSLVPITGCVNDGSPAECDSECEGTDGCEALHGDRWNDDGGCFDPSEFAGCLELEQEPSVVFVSVDEDGDCWRGLGGHPVGWRLNASVPYRCPPDDENGGDALCE